MDRRSLILGSVAGAFLLDHWPAFAQSAGPTPEGTITPPPSFADIAEQIVAGIPPTTDYVAIIETLAALKSPGAPRGPDGEPYCWRWKKYANPLLVRMWRDMGYHGEVNDCDEWCAIAIGWCLKRSGRDVPSNVESSQAYLKSWGTPVDTPQLGDIVVFTDDSPKRAGHGHVTVFKSQVDQNHLIGLGGNQDLSMASNCPAGHPVSAIDERPMTMDTRKYDAQGKAVSGWHVNRYIRPPAPVRAPLQEPKKAGSAVL